MKRGHLILFLSALYLSFTPVKTNSVAQKVFDPLLAVVIMVRDEEQVIVPTLKPFADGGVDAFFLFDTGSVDKTIENAEQFFKSRKITNAYIEQEPFVDFETSRNRALELARKKFPNVGFFIMPDAEWYIKNVEGLLAFCKQIQNDPGSAYMVRLECDIDFYTSRILRAYSSAHFEGVVHEVAVPVSYIKAPKDVYFHLAVSRKGIEKSQKRWLRDRDLLLKKHLEQPSDPRTLFYLAQTHECLGELEEALHFYQLRVAVRGWSEEDYMARFRLAGILEALANKARSSLTAEYTWDRAEKAYLQAFLFRPHRAEPLIKIAKHYIAEDNMQMAFIYAQRAAQIPYPKDDLLFVEKTDYDYTRYDVLGRCAWYVGQFDIGEEALRCGIKNRPKTAHLYNNLKFYAERKK